ncbi:MAG: adenylate/guanylate cyclase domain-containing protein [Chloroflexota bacterium]|nr:adenylate/guanylate cyclase domain-containing protein [Chloroflexota bacterium]
MFTDLSDSTRTARELGDGRWAALLAELNQAARLEIERWNGREVATTGDGFLLVFDSPTRAVRAASAVVAGSRGFGLRSRAGVHIGEVELVGDVVRGVAVHAAARILALARPDEVLVSDTVRDLLTGSGLEFEPRGSRELRGLEGTRTLFALSTA